VIYSIESIPSNMSNPTEGQYIKVGHLKACTLTDLPFCIIPMTINFHDNSS
jgi:hypothetical protein